MVRRGAGTGRGGGQRGQGGEGGDERGEGKIANGHKADVRWALAECGHEQRLVVNCLPMEDPAPQTEHLGMSGEILSRALFLC